MVATASSDADLKGDANQRKHARSAVSVPSVEEAARVTERTRRVAMAFGEIISVLLRAPSHRHLFLADLEWLVLPAIATGQFALAQARHKESGLAAPVAAILWANVSAEVDARLTANASKGIRLKPDEWAAGPHPWLVEGVGEPQAVKALIDQVLLGPLKGRSLTMLTRDVAGKLELRRLKAPDKQDLNGTPGAGHASG